MAWKPRGDAWTSPGAAWCAAGHEGSTGDAIRPPNPRTSWCRPLGAAVHPRGAGPGPLRFRDRAGAAGRRGDCRRRSGRGRAADQPSDPRRDRRRDGCPAGSRPPDRGGRPARGRRRGRTAHQRRLHEGAAGEHAGRRAAQDHQRAGRRGGRTAGEPGVHPRVEPGPGQRARGRRAEELQSGAPRRRGHRLARAGHLQEPGRRAGRGVERLRQRLPRRASSFWKPRTRKTSYGRARRTARTSAPGTRATAKACTSAATPRTDSTSPSPSTRPTRGGTPRSTGTGPATSRSAARPAPTTTTSCSRGR